MENTTSIVLPVRDRHTSCYSIPDEGLVIFTFLNFEIPPQSNFPAHRGPSEWKHNHIGCQLFLPVLYHTQTCWVCTLLHRLACWWILLSTTGHSVDPRGIPLETCLQFNFVLLITASSLAHSASIWATSLSAYLTHTFWTCWWGYCRRYCQRHCWHWDKQLCLNPHPTSQLLHYKSWSGWLSMIFSFVNPCWLLLLPFCPFCYLEMLSGGFSPSSSLRWGCLASSSPYLSSSPQESLPVEVTFQR